MKLVCLSIVHVVDKASIINLSVDFITTFYTL